MQPDGRLVVAGTSGAPEAAPSSLALSRHREDGSLDPSFGGDGTVTADVGSFTGRIDVLIQADGRVVAVGMAGDDEHAGPEAVRYLPDGRPDPSSAETAR